MNIRVEGDKVTDSGKQIGVINGYDILTYPAGKKIGKKSGTDIFDADGHRVGYSNDGIIALFIKNM